MRFKTGTRTRVRIDLELDFDPTGTDVELLVDGEWWPAGWEGTSTEDPVERTWTATARTISYFAGPDVPEPVGAHVLTVGQHPTVLRIVSGQDIISDPSDPIDVG